MRSAIRSSLIMSESDLPSAYCEAERCEQRSRIEVGLAAELLNALGDLVGVFALCIGVLLEFVAHCHGMNASRHKVVVHVAQHANNLGRERLVQDRDGLIYIAFIGVGYRAFFNFLRSPLTNFFYIGNETWHENFPRKGNYRWCRQRHWQTCHGR